MNGSTGVLVSYLKSRRTARLDEVDRPTTYSMIALTWYGFTVVGPVALGSFACILVGAGNPSGSVDELPRVCESTRDEYERDIPR
jgi:hypothetical protein